MRRTARLVQLLQETAEEWDDNPKLSGLLALAAMEIDRLTAEAQRSRDSADEHAAQWDRFAAGEGTLKITESNRDAAETRRLYHEHEDQED